MKKLYMSLLVLPIFALGIGCSATSKLPSVTIGGAANNKAILNASAGKEGVSLTAPLVKVDVPLPSASVNK
jgi:hypothetical protein|tara:strand:- start:3071 stop:3283 length:213 start_codon:yes stop_codon:yes gene_type:complete